MGRPCDPRAYRHHCCQKLQRATERTSELGFGSTRWRNTAEAILRIYPLEFEFEFEFACIR
jgi:hypothetical protein